MSGSTVERRKVVAELKKIACSEATVAYVIAAAAEPLTNQTHLDAVRDGLPNSAGSSLFDLFESCRTE